MIVGWHPLYSSTEAKWSPATILSLQKFQIWTVQNRLRLAETDVQKKINL